MRRLKNSRGHCLWTFCEELDTLLKSNNAGSWANKYDIYRVGFDHGEWGQDYNSDQAESGIVEVGYNFSILGTYGALHRCFSLDNIENGLSSRMIVAEMPDAAFAKMPKVAQPSAEAVAAIDRAVTKLRSQTGYVNTPRLRKAIREWVEEKRLEALRAVDIVKDTYRRRAAVIGFRCGVVARLLVGHESASVLKFATMMAQYVLDEQIRVFGSALNLIYVRAQDVQEKNSCNHSIFDTLPPEFSIEDVKKEKGMGYSLHTLQMMICRWKSAGWVKKVAPNKWRKAKA